MKCSQGIGAAVGSYSGAFARVLALVLLAGATAAEARSRDYFGHFMATCPGDGGCGTEYHQTQKIENFNEVRYIAIGRDGRADSGWIIGLSVLRYGGQYGNGSRFAENLSTPLTVKIDRKKFVLHAVADFSIVDGYLVPTAKQGAAILKAMKKARRMQISFTTSEGEAVSVPIALKGLAASMKWIKKKQKNRSNAYSRAQPTNQDQLLLQY